MTDMHLLTRSLLSVFCKNGRPDTAQSDVKYDYVQYQTPPAEDMTGM